MDCRHLGPQDASGHIHVNLGPGSPCRDDEYDSIYVTYTNFMGEEPSTPTEFSKERRCDIDHGVGAPAEKRNIDFEV